MPIQIQKSSPTKQDKYNHADKCLWNKYAAFHWKLRNVHAKFLFFSFFCLYELVLHFS